MAHQFWVWPLQTWKKLCQLVQYLEFLVEIKPLCGSIFSLKKALNYYHMSRFRSVLSDFTLFVPKSSVCCCLRSFEAPDLEILGISRKFKRPPLIPAKPRQRNSGDYRSQILCRIWFHRSVRRNLPQIRGLQQFDVVDRGLPMPHFTENHGASEG